MSAAVGLEESVASSGSLVHGVAEVRTVQVLVTSVVVLVQVVERTALLSSLVMAVTGRVQRCVMSLLANRVSAMEPISCSAMVADSCV